MRDNILKAALVILLIVACVTIAQLANTVVPNHDVKITYTIGGAERIYIVKSDKISYGDECITFTDDLGYKHTVCGTFETQIIN